jgi:hypothetical protein
MSGAILIDQIIRNMLVLCCVCDGDKINTQSGDIVIVKGGSWFYRDYNESRNKNIEYINSLFSNGFEIKSQLVTNSNSYNELTSAMIRATAGLQALMKTYADDTQIRVSLEICIKNVNRECGVTVDVVEAF